MQAKKPWYFKEVLAGMYVDQELTIRQIAQIFDLAVSTIFYWLKKHEIPIREFDIGTVNKGQTMSDEQKQVLSQKTKERHATKGHPMLGKKLSEETKRKIRISMRKKRHLKHTGESE